MAFAIIRNDITKVAADAVVNTANPKPVVGGGTDTAVYRAAGKRRLLAERKKIGDIAPGQAVSTPAFRLSAKHIIHTVGPVWQGGGSGERDVLRACYANALALAEDLGCESVAFPLIATGAYGFPKDEALQIALSEIGRFLLTHEMKVILVVFDAQSFALSAALTDDIEQFIDDKTAQYLREEEYGATQYTRVAGQASSALLRKKNDRAAEETRPCLQDYDGSFGEDRSAYHLPAEDFCSAMNAPEASADDAPEPPHAPQEQKKAVSPFRRAPRRRLAEPVGAATAASSAAPSPVPFSVFAAGEKSLDEMLDSAGQTFQQKLFELIDASGMDDVTVYKKANIDRKVFSRIRCKEDYRPTKKTAVAFAIALELDMPAMLDLLARAEIAFSPSSKFDLIIAYFITHQIYDIFEINAVLFQYGQPILGA